ncbi:thiamine pyrophosphate-binding protein [Microbacterium alcoholitolerans]|uniref:thiamine pyrophosphate-binding protein n=1 Tax=unclassified Microbacterium TaxID=2609290 RepID=UPI003D183B0C
MTAPQIEKALRRAKVDWAVSVPDWVQLPLYRHLQQGSDMSVVPTCAEDEAIAVAAGLSLTGAVPVVLIQNQGFYAAVNNIRAITLDGDIPMVFIVGQFGLEAAKIGRPFNESGRRVVRMLPRLLDAMELPWRPLDDEADLASVDWAYEQRRNGRSAVLVMSRNLTWEDAS